MASNSGESVMDVLARMKTELSFDVDEMVQAGDSPTTSTASSAAPAAAMPQLMASAPVLKSSASTPAATPTPAAVAAAPSGASDAPDAAEDLNSYMGDLLNRYGKGGVAASAAAAAAAATDAADAFPKSALPQRKPRAASPEVVDDATVSAESGEQDATASVGEGEELLPQELCLLEQQEFKPRKRAPEEKACIDAMRELAVHSARRALQTFDNKRRGLDAKHRLGLAFAAFTTSGVAFMFAEEMFSLLGLVAMCGLATGSMFVVNWQQTVALLKRSTGN